ncbi:MAG: 3-dehydroquinate synthase [Paludibacteraceae bacterium]|nr:3-dehydroquinate synthase [Paludibacteraceae bacterium]
MIYGLQDILQQYDHAQVFVLCDERLRVTDERLRVTGDGLRELSFPTFFIHASEQNKSLDTVACIWNWLSEHGATRKALLINIGGGVTTDLGGFAAATYLRGIDYINIPTTLLAMVDASIGGKTGVNLGGLKNRAGAFHMPKAVLIEPAFLQTLPAEELLSGYAEVLKTTLLHSEQAFAQALVALDELTTTRHIDRKLIEACKQYKESIVAQDPTETGLRKVLNFGHTVGHAIEEAANDQRHGYCVLWGMIAELYLSVALLNCPKEPLQQLTRVMLDYYGRPNCNCKQQHKLIDLMRKDKKNADAKAINFTLLKKAGDPIINQVAADEVIEEALDYLFSL